MPGIDNFNGNTKANLNVFSLTAASCNLTQTLKTKPITFCSVICFVLYFAIAQTYQ